MKRLLLASLLLIFSQVILAQQFNKSIGLRAGLTSGFEYRFYIDDANSFKILLGTNNGLRLHGFKEVHRYDLFTFTDQLSFFYGAGIHGGYENWDKYYVRDNMHWYESRTAFVMGVDALCGLEYLFYEIPLSLGVEYKPFIDIFGRSMFRIEPFDFAFTIKYLF